MNSLSAFFGTVTVSQLYSKRERERCQVKREVAENDPGFDGVMLLGNKPADAVFFFASALPFKKGGAAAQRTHLMRYGAGCSCDCAVSSEIRSGCRDGVNPVLS
jgi:hypothetical protein